MARVSVTDEYNSVEVELWGHEFETIEVTKKRRKKLKPYGEKLTAIERGTFDTLEGNEGKSDEELELAEFGVIGDVLDLRLRPTDGKKTKPSTLVKKRWDDDKISIARAYAILAEIGRADLPS